MYIRVFDEKIRPKTFIEKFVIYYNMFFGYLVHGRSCQRDVHPFQSVIIFKRQLLKFHEILSIYWFV